MGANPVNLGQIGTGDLIEHGADVKIHGVGSSVTTTEFREGRVGIRALRRKQGQGLFYLRIAFLDTGLIDVIQTQCLLQAKDMFRLIVANERSLASTCGSRSPSIMARIIFMPVSPVMSVTTWCSCKFM